jgi:uridylate kinase
LRSLELDADVMLMAKNKVDGVYSADPRVDTAARRYRRISHQEAIERNLKVMDTSALALLRDNDIPIVVFDVSQPSAIEDAAVGHEIGTRVQSGESELFQ